MEDELKQLLREQLTTLEAAAQVLRDSHARVSLILKQDPSTALTVAQKESCEALTARFSRLCDFLFQRAFRTIDRLELQDEGSGIDRLNRTEKRGIIQSARQWRELRELRNQIAHEYLIEKSDRVLRDAHENTALLLDAVDAFRTYAMGLLS